MFGNLLKHRVDVAALILRFGLASVFVIHGYLKIVVGNETTSELVSGMSSTTMLAVGWAEFVCAILIGVGLFTRVVGIVVIVLQMVAISVVSGSMVPHVVRSDAGRAEYISIGSEFNMILIASFLALIVLGAGMVSVDHLLAARWCAKKGTTAPPAGSAAS